MPNPRQIASEGKCARHLAKVRITKVYFTFCALTTLGNEQMTNPRPAPARKGGLMHNGVFSLCVSFKLRLVRFAIHTRATTHSLTDMVH